MDTDTLSLEEVLESKNIFIITYPNSKGVYFICMDDWYVPSDNKRWYKLSLNPSLYINPKLLHINSIHYMYIMYS